MEICKTICDAQNCMANVDVCYAILQAAKINSKSHGFMYILATHVFDSACAHEHIIRTNNVNVDSGEIDCVWLLSQWLHYTHT